MTDREEFEAAWKEYNTPEAFSEFGRELAYWGWQAALASERGKRDTKQQCWEAALAAYRAKQAEPKEKP